MRHLVLIALLLVAPIGAIASKKNLPPKAPLPSQISLAHKVFIQNGGGSDLAYDAVYQKFKEWGKYEIVGSPAEADLVISIRYWGESHGSHGSGYVDPYSNTITTTSRDTERHYIGLAITDPKTGQDLWTTSTERKLVLRWHVDKEIVKTAGLLVDELKARVQP